MFNSIRYVVDVISALTDSKEPRKYWSVLKKEGSEVTTFCSQLKMLAPDGKMRLRDILDTKGIRKESLRDNMTDIEVALTNIGEIATRDIAKVEHPKGLKENL